MDKIINIIFALILITIIIGFISFGIIEGNKYIYECTDYKGDIVYCKDARWTKGGMYGTLEDGTMITITSYRQVLKEEAENE